MQLRAIYSPNDPDMIDVNDSRSINNAIAKAVESGCNMVVIPRLNARSNSYSWIIGEPIMLPSNITVILDGCYMVQEESCYCNMFLTAGALDSDNKTIDHELCNIRIIGQNHPVLDGGVYNGFSEWHSPPGTLFNNITMLFVNVNGFTVEGIKIRHMRWWSMAYYYCRNGIIRNVEFDADFASIGPDGERVEALPEKYGDVYIKNGDGVDIRCGCNNILIENITGRTEDDTVALTALMGTFEKRFFIEGKDWDIHNITINNVSSDCLSGGQLRLLCADGTKVHDVIVDSLMDTTARRAWQCNVFLGYAILGEYIRNRTSIRGEMSNISINNVFSHSTRAILAGCAVENLHLSNIFCSKEVEFAIQTSNISSFNSTWIDGVYCAEGACSDTIFNFCSETEGEMQISHVYAHHCAHVVRNAGPMNVTLTDCQVERITDSLMSREYNQNFPY